ncbi:MAG: molybdopterin dinucleotide binding domain-containing protein, partial [Desulfitobacteriaceae bacterium]|nr:molybdopterin dinucleotide binding domain-containing protein [Desulfitobacteriaceae bacterium]
GGTTYENKQGIGVHLPNAIQRGEQVTLGWPALAQGENANEGWLAVPITKLYDEGTTLLPSTLLNQRRIGAIVWLHPSDAAANALQKGELVHLQFGEASAMATVTLDENVPQGIVLLPRSAGIPLHEPHSVQIKVVERS